MNSDAVKALIEKTPALKAAKTRLESMEPGSYCVHRSWGFGLIKDYDEVEQKLVIDFEGKKGHHMDPAFCIATMEVLPPKHLLVRKLTEPKVIAKLIEEDPVQLVIDALMLCPNQATTAIDLELQLAQVLGEEKFKKWWSAAKKILAKDPRIAVPAKKTECYVVRAEPVSHEDEIVEQFNGTRSARRRIALAEKLVAAAGKKEVKASLAPVLQGIADAVKANTQLEPAERL